MKEKYMFGKKLIAIDEKHYLDNAEADYKNAKRIGQFKVSENAIYKPDGTYLPLSLVSGITQDKTSVHVSGCCAGGVPVERLIFDTEDGRYPFIFDSKKDVDKVLKIIGERNGNII